VINRKYFVYYKILPYKIEADDEKMICSNFLFSQKVVTVYYKNIDMLKGGVFSGRLSGVMKIHDGKNKVEIGFSHKINNSGRLISLMLSKVSKELYNEIIDHLINKQRTKKNNPN
jgi:hypothetical protein